MFFEVLVLLFGIALLIIAILINIMSDNIDKEDNKAISAIAFFAGLLIMGGLIMCEEAHRPSPIDVYRNKTELQIEYRIINNDTISVDSTVVFKKNFK